MAKYTKEGLLRRIALRIREMDISESKASERAGFARTYIKELRNGTTASPTLDALQKLADGLECDPVWLLTGIEPTISDPETIELAEIRRLVSKPRLSALMETARSFALAESAEVPLPAKRGRPKKR